MLACGDAIVCVSPVKTKKYETVSNVIESLREKNENVNVLCERQVLILENYMCLSS